MEEKVHQVITCEKCGKTMNDDQFYSYRDGRKAEICKKCITLHVDNFDESTYVWILKKFDFPYDRPSWNSLRDRAFAKNPNLTGMSILGKYLAKMRIKPWNQYTWADTEKLEAQHAESQAAIAEAREQREAEVKALYEKGEISEAEYNTYRSTAEQYKEHLLHSADEVPDNGNRFQEDNFMSADELPDPGSELTQEDKIMLAVKWGRLYTPSEWISLEKDYQDMMNSFDIQDADTKNTLIHLCKTNLKMNQAIDSGDVDGYQKLSKVYDALRKSAKFTAAQKKDATDQAFDSVGSIVAFCEKEGGKIPRYDLSVDRDKADTAISDIKNYLKTLIYNDTNLAQQIERYLKQLTLSQQAKEDRQKAKEQGLDYVPISDADLQEFNDSIASQQDEDAEDDDS